jgi:ribosome production factor 1
MSLISHSYAFRSTEKVALQEIGPRFTLKLRSLRKGIPAVKNLGEHIDSTVFDADEQSAEAATTGDKDNVQSPPITSTPPKEDEYLWRWKVSFQHT